VVVLVDVLREGENAVETEFDERPELRAPQRSS
jgi:hypothetical protein